MNDRQETHQQLLDENSDLRQRLCELQAELAEYRQNESDRQQMDQYMPVLIGIAGLDGYSKKVNAAFQRILGWSREELEAKPFLEFFHPEDRPATAAVIERLKTGEPITDHFTRILCKDGSTRWIKWTIIPLLDREFLFGIGLDITELKQIEQALAESQRRLSTLLSHLPGAAYRCVADDSFTVEYLSEGFRALTGHDPAEMIGQPGSRCWEMVHPEDREQALKLVHESIQQCQRYKAEYRLSTKTGEEKWVWEQGTGIFSEQGELEAVEGFSIDITARKQAELELQLTRAELEQRVKQRTTELSQANATLRIFKAFAETSAEGFGMADMNDRIVYANAALARMVGAATPDAMLNTSPLHYYTSDSESVFLREVRPALTSEGSWQGQLTLVSLTGEEIPVLQTSFIVKDQNGTPLRRAVAITDLRRLNEAEASLRLSEARYRALVESSPDAVIMCTPDGRIEFASPQAAERHGVDDPSELVGLYADDLVVEHERSIVKDKIRRLLQSGIRRNDHYTGLRKDGTTFYGEISAAVIQGNPGAPSSFVAVYRDITERKEAQDSLRRERAALRRMLEASDNDRTLITYEIHDTVAQRLAGALMHFQAMEEITDEIPEKAKSNLEAGLRALRQATGETRRLMNRTRSPILDRFGISSAIADFINQYADQPNTPAITFDCNAEVPRLEPVLENSILRVAQEAITNAYLHSSATQIHVSVEHDDDELNISIEDNGIGFDTSNNHHGHFGLDSIRERTRLLGNGLRIESSLGNGTRIRATFPLLHRID